jgi:hypothetical protein
MGLTALRRSRKIVMMIMMRKMERKTQMIGRIMRNGRTARVGRIMRRQTVMVNFEFGMILLPPVQL